MKIARHLHLLLLSACFFPLASAGQQAEKPRPVYYEFDVYHFSTAEQEQVLDQYLQQALLPALHRLKMGPVGVFKAIANDTATGKKIYVCIQFAAWPLIAQLQARLHNDTAYLSAASACLNAAFDHPAFNRRETILAKAFSGAPSLTVPALKAPKNERVYELRSYESPTETLFRNKLQMFNGGDEIGLFRRLNFNAIFYSEVVAGSNMPNLMYMTSFENMADREAHWKSFVEDAYWKKLSSMPEYQHNVSHIDISFLRPADYSDY